MTEHEGPPRLKSGKEASHELRQALRALGNQHNNPPRLARAAENLDKLLHAVPAAPPAFPVKSRLWRHAQNKVLATRLAVALLAAGGGSAVWLAHPTRSEQAPPSSLVAAPNAPAADHAHAFAARVEPTPSAWSEQASTSPLVRETVRTTRDDASSNPHAHKTVRSKADGPSASSRLRESGREASKAERSVTLPGDITTETRPSAALASSPPERAPSQEAVEAMGAPAQQPAAKTQAPPTEARELNEVELLFAAQQQLRSDPRAGLRLLDEHRARFPRGQLAPEREVLAIEVLRKLGQTDAAAKRFAAFRVRYPDSLHLQRLAE